MSWLNDLYLTFEACKSEVGVVRDSAPILLPVAHSTQNAQIEIVLDQDGDFLDAVEVEKKQAVTVIPVTEDSGSRSGKAVFPHPLADKLEYLAGDYGDYVPDCNPKKFEMYAKQLQAWAESPYAVPEIKSVWKYIQKGMVIKDLITKKLAVVENGILGGGKIQGVLPREWFVRFSVEIPGNLEPRLYCSPEVFESYSKYYTALQKTTGLCYVTGEMVPCAEKHPAKIRNTGDKAKLISANDTSGYTYRGRFLNSGQVASVSYEVSQKAHNALRWLIARQASLRAGEQVILVWAINNPDMTDPFVEISFDTEETPVWTDEAYARQIRNAIWGNKRKIAPSDDVIVMGVEAATIGRLSVTFYQKYNAEDFLNHIVQWKQEVCWLKREGNEAAPVPWSPSLYEIVKLVAGDKNDKLVKMTRERLLPCIVEGRRLPRDMVNVAIQEAIHPSHYKRDYEWKNALMTACAMIRKYQIQAGKKKEECKMSLDENNSDRSYLYGRWLATAERLESFAMKKNGQKEYRNTAAEKYFVRFQRYPVQTQQIIRNQLQPYVMKLNSSETKSDFYVKQLDKITAKLEAQDSRNMGKLDAQFLQGYSCQMAEYRNYIEKANKENKEEEE